MITTTLNKIREHHPCADGWKKLLAYLGKTEPDDEPLPFATIIESNGLDDALWCCRAAPEYDKEWRLFAVWCARHVQHLMKDQRGRDAIDVVERFAHGLATAKELTAAWAAAEDAAEDAAWATARTAARAAARAAAEAAAWAATGAAAEDAARAAVLGAWGAARAAAWAAAEDAAEDAAWAAARAAAWAATGAAVRAAAWGAWGAARAAAREKQEQEFIQIINQ